MRGASVPPIPGVDRVTAVRERLAGTAGNSPQTRILCDWTTADGAGCPNNVNPPTSWDAREARRVARSLGYTRVNGKDWCPEHQCPHGYVPGDHHYEKGTCGPGSFAVPEEWRA